MLPEPAPKRQSEVGSPRRGLPLPASARRPPFTPCSLMLPEPVWALHCRLRSADLDVATACIGTRHGMSSAGCYRCPYPRKECL